MPNPMKNDYTTKVIPGKYRRIDLTGREFMRSITTEHEPYRPGNCDDRNGKMQWSGNVTFDQAIELYKNGWPKGLENVNEIQSQIVDRLQCRYSKREMCYEVFGGQPDVGVFLANDPENMIHRTVNDQESSSISERKVIKMVVNCVANAGQDNDRIASIRGAISMAIIDVLEDMGYRVELEAAFAVGIHNGRFPEKQDDFHILIKAANWPLDRERIAYMMCHGSVLRRLGLALMENYGHDNSNSYGQSATCVEQGDLYIPHADVFKFGNNLEEWIKTTLDFLSKVGVQLEDK